jgi:hypothetical protein
MPVHVIEPGDSIAELAEIHGLFAQTIWDDPRNSALRTKRERYDALAVGDVLFIPERRERVEEVAVDARYRFKRRGIPAKVRLHICVSGASQAKTAYSVQVDGRSITGQTDANGVAEFFVPAAARRAILELDTGLAFTLVLGGLRPGNTVPGIRQRIENEGIVCPAHDDIEHPDWRFTLFELQRRLGLPVTARLDRETWQALMQIHDAMERQT